MCEIRKPSAWYIFHRIAGSGIFDGKGFHEQERTRGASAGYVFADQEV